MIIIAATLTEASPLISKLHLQEKRKRPFKIYQNDDLVLVVSGIGKTKAAAALSHALSLYDGPVVNIGIAAGEEIAKIYNIYKIIDKESEKVFHLPKIQNLSNTVLTTYAKPATTPHHTLVDMEAAALVECARIYREDITVLKVVSDIFQPHHLQREDVPTLIQKNIKPILDIIASKKKEGK